MNLVNNKTIYILYKSDIKQNRTRHRRIVLESDNQKKEAIFQSIALLSHSRGRYKKKVSDFEKKTKEETKDAIEIK